MPIERRIAESGLWHANRAGVENGTLSEGDKTLSVSYALKFSSNATPHNCVLAKAKRATTPRLPGPWGTPGSSRLELSFSTPRSARHLLLRPNLLLPSLPLAPRFGARSGPPSTKASPDLCLLKLTRTDSFKSKFVMQTENPKGVGGSRSPRQNELRQDDLLLFDCTGGAKIVVTTIRRTMGSQLNCKSPEGRESLLLIMFSSCLGTSLVPGVTHVFSKYFVDGTLSAEQDQDISHA